MNDRDWLSPVTLTGEYPVTQLVVYCCASDSHLFDHMWSFFLKHRRLHTVPLTGVDHCSDCICICLSHILDLFSVFCDNLNDRNIEFCCELEVTVVMCRYTHDCSCTVVSQYIIRQPDRCLCSIQWVDRIASCENSCLLFVLHTVNIGLHRCIINIFLYCISCLICCERCCQFVLRSKYHKCSSVECIRSCCINSDLLISSFYREVNFCTVRFSDPVSLHLLNLLRPVKFIKVIQQTVCIFCNAKHPLTKVLLCNVCTTTLTFTIHNLFVCKTCLTGRTPVDRELFFISKTFLEHLNKDPLCPLVELRICCIHFHIPVIQCCDIIDLSLDVRNIRLCGFRRVNAHLDRIVLSRKTECIPSHWMNDVVSLL